MKAKIEAVKFGEGKLIVDVGFYFSEGEEGYGECYREVKEMVEDELVGTGVWKLYMFNHFGFKVSLDATKVDIEEAVLTKLRAFKDAHTKVAKMQGLVGFEIEE